MKKLGLGFATLMALAACGNEGFTYCYIEGSHFCMGYAKAHHTEDNATIACTGSNGMVVEECPMQDQQVGMCDGTNGIVTYYYPPITASTAEQSCTASSGEYTAH